MSGNPERLAELGRQGGQKNRRWKHDESDLPQRSLKSIGEVTALLEETINRLRRDAPATNIATRNQFKSFVTVR
jgi:hypothetical protein